MKRLEEKRENNRSRVLTEEKERVGKVKRIKIPENVHGVWFLSYQEGRTIKEKLINMICEKRS